jgi:hypothetical protein
MFSFNITTRNIIIPYLEIHRRDANTPAIQLTQGVSTRPSTRSTFPRDVTPMCYFSLLFLFYRRTIPVIHIE